MEIAYRKGHLDNSGFPDRVEGVEEHFVFKLNPCIHNTPVNIDFYTAEAFTERPFHGAQIAVFPEAGALSEAQMQRLAAEMNLSETVFVTGREGERFFLRVFSPLKEVEFAVHPIIATGHVLASLGLVDLEESPRRIEFVGQSG